MKTYDDLLSRWDSCRGGQILVDHQHPIKNMFLNINEKGNRELLIPVKKPIKKFQSTEAIGITNYKAPGSYYFAIELLSENLVKEYACLCFEHPAHAQRKSKLQIPYSRHFRNGIL